MAAVLGRASAQAWAAARPAQAGRAGPQARSGSGTAGTISGTGGAGLAAGRKMVAAGLIDSTAGSSSASPLATLPATGFRIRFPAASFTSPAVLTAAASPRTSASAGTSFGLAGRLGLLSMGRSRPRPSLTRSSLAVSVGTGVIARTPLCPMPSRATIKSLLVTPNSFARSMTFTRAAKAPLPPPPGFQNHRRALGRRLARPPESMSQPSTDQRLPQTCLIGASIRPASCRRAVRVHPHASIRAAHQPDEKRPWRESAGIQYTSGGAWSCRHSPAVDGALGS